MKIVDSYQVNQVRQFANCIKLQKTADARPAMHFSTSLIMASEAESPYPTYSPDSINQNGTIATPHPSEKLSMDDVLSRRDLSAMTHEDLHAMLFEMARNGIISSDDAWDASCYAGMIYEHNKAMRESKGLSEQFRDKILNFYDLIAQIERTEKEGRQGTFHMWLDNTTQERRDSIKAVYARLIEALEAQRKVDNEYEETV